MRWTRTLSIVFALVCSSCSSSTEAPAPSGAKTVPPDFPTELALDELPHQIAEAICARHTECTGELFTEESPDCVESAAHRFRETVVGAWTRLVTAGDVSYDARAAAACIATLRFGTCEDYRSLWRHETCRAAFPGGADVGQPCDDDVQCAGGTGCIFDGVSCPGSCQAPRVDGASCTAHEHCALGSFCAGDGRCRAQLGAGAACTDGDECAGGLWCMGTAGGERCLSLSRRAREGEACTDLPCATGLSCAPEIGAPIGSGDWSCIASVESGGPCRLAWPNPCPADEYCRSDDPNEMSGTCVPLPGAGEPCAERLAPAVYTYCGAATACDHDTSTCVELSENGQPCRGDAECWSELCRAGTCELRSQCTALGE